VAAKSPVRLSEVVASLPHFRGCRFNTGDTLEPYFASRWDEMTGTARVEAFTGHSVGFLQEFCVKATLTLSS